MINYNHKNSLITSTLSIVASVAARYPSVSVEDDTFTEENEQRPSRAFMEKLRERVRQSHERPATVVRCHSLDELNRRIMADIEKAGEWEEEEKNREANAIADRLIEALKAAQEKSAREEQAVSFPPF